MKPKDREFQHHFGVRDKFMDVFISHVSGVYSLDVIRLDKWLKSNHGYTENEHGSCADFIKIKFGQEALDFISSLMGGE